MIGRYSYYLTGRFSGCTAGVLNMGMSMSMGMGMVFGMGTLSA